MNLRLLILGAGAVTTEYYLPALVRLGRIRETAVVDASRPAIHAVASAYPGLETHCVSAADALNDARIYSRFDAAVIALPNHLHAAAVSAALKAGLAVLCEKPLDADPEVCLRLGREAEQAGRVLAVGMVRRLIPAMRTLKEALSRGEIGKILSVEMEHGEPYAWVSDSGAAFDRRNGGVLTDLGVHYLDLASDLLGPLKPVGYSDDHAGGVESEAEFNLMSEAGVPVKLRLSWRRRLANRLTVKGSAGECTVRNDDFLNCRLRGRDAQDEKMLRSEKPFANVDGPPDFISCFAEELSELENAVKSAGRFVGAADAARSMRLIQWAYEHRAGRAEPPAADGIPLLPAGRVVVTGGTGFIGSHLIERLALGKSEIIAPVRRFRNAYRIARFPVSMPRVDLLDVRSLREHMRGARFVFHLAYGRDDRESFITDIGTRRVVSAAVAEHVESVVVLSTTQVFGKPSHRIVDERFPYRPSMGRYGKSKARMERWCLRMARGCGNTRIVVLNPSCVYGPGGETYSILPWRLAHEKSFCWVDGGGGTANYTYVDNLIDAMVLAATSVRARGERLIISDGHCSWREFYDPIFREFGLSARALSVRELRAAGRRESAARWAQFLRAVVRRKGIAEASRGLPVMDALKRVLADRAPRLRQKLKNATSSSESAAAGRTTSPPTWLAELFGPEDTVYSSNQARALLGWSPRVGLAGGQRATELWLREFADALL